jgi:hypothetical protein
MMSAKKVRLYGCAGARVSVFFQRAAQDLCSDADNSATLRKNSMVAQAACKREGVQQ